MSSLCLGRGLGCDIQPSHHEIQELPLGVGLLLLLLFHPKGGREQRKGN